MELSIKVWGGECSPEEIATEAERIAQMICDGFTSGEVITENTAGGWWSLTETEA